jgi:hypothetical protein
MLKILQTIFIGDIYLCLSLLEPLNINESMPITRYRTVMEVAGLRWHKRIFMVWLLSKLEYIDWFYKGNNPTYIRCYSLTDLGRECLNHLNQTIEKLRWEEEQGNR